MKVKKWGPGLLVTAAFIGPGTVTVASKSGATFGYSLLWVVVFSVLATMVFQEMAARLGVVTGHDLSVALRMSSRKRLLRFGIIGLVLGAILIGNAAYQAGNIGGATTGLSVLTGYSIIVWAVIIAVAAAVVLMSGRFVIIQAVLVTLVAIMSGLFVLSMIIVQPDWPAIGAGLMVPHIENAEGGLLMVIGLLGTTVVPYNLFLHSRSAVETWHGDGDVSESLTQARRDSAFSILLGGVITASIIITAAAAFFEKGMNINNLAEIAAQLRPVLGQASEAVFCLGLAAAGLTSAITAPLAAGFATAGCLGWNREISDWRTRVVMLGVIGAGLATICLLSKGSDPSQMGASPEQIIVFAQVANGLILPVVAIFLLYVMNQPRFLGRFRNGWLANALGAFVIVVAVALAARQMYSAGTKIQSWFEPAVAQQSGQPLSNAAGHRHDITATLKHRRPFLATRREVAATVNDPRAVCLPSDIQGSSSTLFR